MGTTWLKKSLRQHLGRWAKELRPQPPTTISPIEETPGEGSALTRQRFLSDQPQRSAAFLEAAHQYVDKLDADGLAWLYAKPFDRTEGNESFYTELYQILNILRAMNLPAGARVLEVGSGPGWVTEILMMFGFEVDGIEPNERMIGIAQERVDSCRQHHRLRQPPRVTFHCQTLEDCDLPDDSCDAILFHESLHHIIDEHRGLAQCGRILRPGGILGVCESAWQPENRKLEEELEAEMVRYGTLENPYTQQYLDGLLQEHGFAQIRRFHGINGLFPAAAGHHPLEKLAQFPATNSNILTAVKPGNTGASTRYAADPRAQTKAKIEVLETRLDAAARKVYLKLQLLNTGDTIWLHGTQPAGGFVTVCLRQGKPQSPKFREAEPRHSLPEAVAPKQTLILETTFQLPEDYRRHPWYLDLVNEHYFWFSSRGTIPAELKF